MTEYREDYPTLSAGPPPVMYSDHVYDYPADPRPSWQTPLAIAGAALAGFAAAAVVGATEVAIPLFFRRVVVRTWHASCGFLLLWLNWPIGNSPALCSFT